MAVVRADEPSFRVVSEIAQDPSVDGWLSARLDHIARHDPARVLADIAAKRAIVAWCSERDKVQINAGDPSDPQNYIEGEYSHGPDSVVLRLLVQPFAEHADFDPAWRT